MTNSMTAAVSWRDNCGAITLHLDKVKVPRPPDKKKKYSSSSSTVLVAQHQPPLQQQARVESASAKDMKTVALQRELLAEEQDHVLIGTKQQRLAQAAACPRDRIVVARAASSSGVQGHAQWEPCPERGRAVLTVLFVESQHRRAGVGSALLAAAEAHALSCGFAFFQVKLQMTHMQASVFFQCSGFALVSNDRDGTLTYEKALR